MKNLILFTFLINAFLLIPISFAGECTNINKVPICHVGAGAHPQDKSVNICIDFGGLWGHIVQHPGDYVGECGVDVEDNLKVWACNAGLKHPEHSDRKCFDLNLGGVEVTSCSGLTNCLCSGDALPQILNQFDYFEFAIAQEFNGAPTGPYTLQQKTAGLSTYSQATQKQGTEILNKELGATFSLGSERFGSHYFLDICWKYLDESLYDVPMKVEVNLSLAENIFQGSTGYLPMAKVNQQSAIFCDPSEDFLGDLTFNSNPVTTTPKLPFLNGTRSFGTVISQTRGCFARLQFSETQNEVLRPWDLKKVKLSAQLDVSPVNPLPPRSEGLRFCNVRRVRGNSFTCEQLDFPDTESLRAYLQTQYNDIRSWTQEHNLDYRGDCRSKCEPLTGNEGNAN